MRFRDSTSLSFKEPYMVERDELHFLYGTADPRPVMDMETRMSPKELAFQMIDAIDLEQVKAKLCLSAEEGGQGWTKQRAQECDKWYRRFLKLHVVYKTSAIVPTKDMDQMWHQHILWTKQYHQDCKDIFGSYLHHLPSTGSPREKINSRILFAATLCMFKKEFGESPVSHAKDEAAARCFCNNNCGSCMGSK